jgi:sulfate adenylyltransferase subunit 2
MRHLRDLEAQSINILREAYSNLDLAMFWSKEKESTVLLWLARKAFNGQVPIPLIQIDTGYDLPELVEYQDRLCREWRLNRAVKQTNSALAVWEDFNRGRGTSCDIKEIEMLEEAMTQHCWTALILDTRGDTEGTPINRHCFALSQTHREWDLRARQPEEWDPRRRSIPDGSYIRVHPLLDWTEFDIWEYLERERIVLPESHLYRSRVEYALHGIE